MDCDRQSLSSSSSRLHTFERPGSDIKKSGTLKKMKTMKKKYFVLRSTSSSGPARMEYYDSEKKFKSGHPPKRSIHLHTCFNINKKSDSRHGKCGIALYTADECFTVLADSEQEQEAWLSVILEFQNEYLPDGDMHREHYDHVWQVTLQPRGLGKGVKGQYRLCLNTSTVSLVRASTSQPQFAIQLVTIRSVAHHENSFRLEVGNYAPTGAGEFWLTVEDANIAKDMHANLLHYMNNVKDPSLRLSGHFRSKRENQSQSVAGSHNALSASSPSNPVAGGPRLWSESRLSRTSKNGFSDDECPDLTTHSGYPRDHHDEVVKEHCSIVPIDMSPPPSPRCLDDQISAYLAMDMERDRHPAPIPRPDPSYLMMNPEPRSPDPSYLMMNPEPRSPDPSYLVMNPEPRSPDPSYLMMNPEPRGQPHKGELGSPLSDLPPPAGYMSMASHHSAAIPIHSHSFSEPMHSSHLPTVREGGSNEGYLPMDVSSSPASSSGLPRPEPATCLLADDSSTLPPRTYSLGSKPVKKFSSYMDMGLKKGAANDIPRATSAPHILKGRRDRERRTESPTPSASPLSMSLKSDDSDSFMEYMPMRPRTSSDGFNCRTRTSSFGKLQQTHRPRSSSHGQGTRPVINVNKLKAAQEPLYRTSRESSLQGSFDSLRISNESLRRMSQDMRQVGDYADMRGTPSPQTKATGSDVDGYVNMKVGGGARRSSPHRKRTDSSGSGHHSDRNSSDRLHQQNSDYTEMAPLHSGAVMGRESYMNMDYSPQHCSSTRSKPVPGQEDTRCVNVDGAGGSRSLSVENVDTYIVFDPHAGAGAKPRTGSFGAKDKNSCRPISARKSSSASMPLSTSPTVHQEHHLPVSVRSGAGNDPMRKCSHQLPMEKYGVLNKEFRKKSGSTGTRPSSSRSFSAQEVGISVKKCPSPKFSHDDTADEYIEFSPTCPEENRHHFDMGALTSSSSFASVRSSSPAGDDAYTMFNPAAVSSVKPSHFHHQVHIRQPQIKTVSSVLPQQIAARDVPEYVGFQPVGPFPAMTQPVSPFPATMQPVSPSPATTQPVSPFPVMTQPVSPSPALMQDLRSVKQVHAKAKPQHIGFEPQLTPLSVHSTTMHTTAKPACGKIQDEYVIFQSHRHSGPSPQTFTQQAFTQQPASLKQSRHNYPVEMNLQMSTGGNFPAKQQPAVATCQTAPATLTQPTPSPQGQNEGPYMSYSPDRSNQVDPMSTVLDSSCGELTIDVSSPIPEQQCPSNAFQLSPVSKQLVSPHFLPPQSPDCGVNPVQKLLSSPAVSDSPSPTGSGSRHKHWSGSSNSSHRSDTARKGSKSDSNSSINSLGGRSKRRIPSGEKSLGVGQDEGGQSIGMSLEAKIIPAEAKIRYSLADVTEATNSQPGMIRPDSTPCMQNLAPCPDQGSRSVGDSPSCTPRSGSLQFHIGPRSRHSLSDLGAYQQMTFVTSGANCESSKQGSGDSTDCSLKPLNYVRLDLTCPDVHSDTDGKTSRVRGRNLSDADEKQLPLSYAQIDFVRSQSLNKTLAIGNSAEITSSKP